MKLMLIKAVAYLDPDPKEGLPRKEVDTGSASYIMGSYSKQNLQHQDLTAFTLSDFIM